MMKFGKRTATLVTGLTLGIVGAVPSAQATLTVTSAGQLYTQNFDSLTSTTSSTNLTWANDSTLPGWSLFIRNGGNVPATTYRGDNGGSNTGYFYSYGITGDTDRALGSVGSSSSTGYWGTVASGTVAGWIAVAAQNTSGTDLTGFTANFTGEQWRDGGNSPAVPQSTTVEYGFGSTFNGVATWNAAGPAFTFTSPTFNTTAATLNGNLASNRVTGLGGTINSTWANGQTLWLRWAEVNDNGSDHGLAIDNFSLTAGQAAPAAVPLPAAAWLLGAGLGALGWTGRRRARG